jgi:hypothetical protein
VEYDFALSLGILLPGNRFSVPNQTLKNHQYSCLLYSSLWAGRTDMSIIPGYSASYPADLCPRLGGIHGIRWHPLQAPKPYSMQQLLDGIFARNADADTKYDTARFQGLPGKTDDSNSLVQMPEAAFTACKHHGWYCEEE